MRLAAAGALDLEGIIIRLLLGVVRAEVIDTYAEVSSEWDCCWLMPRHWRAENWLMQKIESK